LNGALHQVAQVEGSKRHPEQVNPALNPHVFANVVALAPIALATPTVRPNTWTNIPGEQNSEVMRNRANLRVQNDHRRDREHSPLSAQLKGLTPSNYFVRVTGSFSCVMSEAKAPGHVCSVYGSGALWRGALSVTIATKLAASAVARQWEEAYGHDGHDGRV
jgi:hypothetical protein